MVGSFLVITLRFLGGSLIGPASAELLIPVAIGDCVFGQVTLGAGQVFQTFERMRTTAALNLVTNLLRAALAGGMLVTLHRATAQQWATASLAVSGAAMILALQAVSTQLGNPELRPRLLLTHAKEGLLFAISGSTTSIYNDLDKTMLSHYRMNLANGIYTMAYRIVDIATIPARAIQSAALSQLFRAGARGTCGTVPIALRLIKRSSILTLAAVMGMFAMAPVLPRLLGTGFSESVTALRWLCLIPLLRSFHLSAGDAITGAGHQEWRLGSQSAAAAANFGLNIWLIPLHGWRGAAWASLATDGILGCMNWVVLIWLDRRSEPATRSHPAPRRLDLSN
jgi:O-antigen/teichoic acid export membrane protein